MTPRETILIIGFVAGTVCYAVVLYAVNLFFRKTALALASLNERVSELEQQR